jgi:hypothetical protein
MDVLIDPEFREMLGALADLFVASDCGGAMVDCTSEVILENVMVAS